MDYIQPATNRNVYNFILYNSIYNMQFNIKLTEMY